MNGHVIEFVNFHCVESRTLAITSQPISNAQTVKESVSHFIGLLQIA
jgi:hypothetical protein